MHSKLFGVAVAAVCLFAFQSLAQTPERRVALVIGNAAYKEQPLKNAVNDARAMAKRLTELGFEVIARENVTRAEIGSMIAEFVGRLKPDTAALFYYAGHGIQVDGRNYLIPVDAVIDAEAAVPFAGVDISQINDRMDRANARVKLMVLDACRNNPFEAKLRGSATGRGLAPMDAARGSLIAFATAPGSVAADGDGANGIYTGALLEALSMPGLSAEEVFKRARTAVAESTKGAQTPWEQSSLVGTFVFNVTVTVASPSIFDREALYWQTIKDSQNAADYEDYLTQYRDGQFATIAKRRVEEIRRLQTAAPPQSPEIAIEPIDKPYTVASSARAREAPDVRSAIVTILKRGETVHVLGKVKGQNWYQIEIGGRSPGYVASSLLTDVTQLATAAPAPMTPPVPAQPAAGPHRPMPRPFPSVGQSFKDCPGCPEMVVVPPGATVLGEGQATNYYGTGPLGTVSRITVARPFAAGKYEVTFAEWDECLLDGGCPYRPRDEGWGRGRQPVINVAWTDAKQYVAWLSRKTGRTYRLLSEAQWEYVARAGRRGDVGGTAELRQANTANCNGCGSQWNGKQPSPVGSFGPNGFGLFDLLGNVWEWTEDCWNPSYTGAPTEGQAWLEGNCDYRVRRGGSWGDGSNSVHASNRFQHYTTDRSFIVGFRVAADP